MGLNRNLGQLTEVVKESGGLIGIGTTGPLNKLDVAGNISLSNGGANVIRMLQSVAAAAYNGPGFYSQTSIGYGVNANNSHIFIGGSDGNTELIRINGGGDVGIGTASPSAKLHVESNFGSSFTALRLQNTAAATTGNKLDIDFWFKSTAWTNARTAQISAVTTDTYWPNTSIVFSNHSQTSAAGLTERMRIDANGTALFKRTTSLDPSYAAGFEGAIFFKTAANGNNTVNFFNASTTYVASIVTNASSIVYGTGSDYRLKEDLKDFNGLEKISKIKVYDFKFIKEGDRMDGVLAHELQEIVPYAVTGEKDEVDDKGNIKIQNVDYSKLTPVLIKAIQEQQEIIKQLTNRIINLENK